MMIILTYPVDWTEFSSVQSDFVIGVIRDSVLWNLEKTLTHATLKC